MDITQCNSLSWTHLITQCSQSRDSLTCHIPGAEAVYVHGVDVVMHGLHLHTHQ
jgi:hypothetical protein